LICRDMGLVWVVWGLLFWLFQAAGSLFKVCSLTCRAVARSHAADSGGGPGGGEAPVQGRAEVDERLSGDKPSLNPIRPTP
jgi:hypothetical protein